MQITILVGSMHGTATSIAQTLQLCEQEIAASIEVLPMDDLEIDVFDRPGLFIVCTSTTGTGDVPDNAQHFFHALDAQAKYLGHVRYGLVALGDASYGESFLGGGRQFDARLADLGAQRLGEICVLDAMETSDPQAHAMDWLQRWAPFARNSTHS